MAAIIIMGNVESHRAFSTKHRVRCVSLLSKVGLFRQTNRMKSSAFWTTRLFRYSDLLLAPRELKPEPVKTRQHAKSHKSQNSPVQRQQF